MADSKYEIEIKSLLGEQGAADTLRDSLRKIDPTLACAASYTQLNHYFEGGDPKVLADHLSTRVTPETAERMRTIAAGEKVSVRTREMNGVAKIVMKASIGSDSSENGVMRMEIEEPVEGLSLEALDQEVLLAGYRYQAKWSRSREEYQLKDVTICLDKNAGYGYLAEFEKVVDSPEHAESARKELEALMQELGVAELPQDRLERMFAFYNEHWPEYYGTEKVFTVE